MGSGASKQSTNNFGQSGGFQGAGFYAADVYSYHSSPLRGQPQQPAAYGFMSRVVQGQQPPYSPHETADHKQQAIYPSENAVGSPGEESDLDDWTLDRDRTYMMVLSADEFLGRMGETDDSIRTLSTETKNPELNRNTIQKQLGLRGHLQDELLRIEQMLAANDPRLKCLKQFERKFPHVVSKIRELRNKSQMVRAKAIQEELPPSTQTGSDTNETGTQADGVKTGSLGTQSSATDALPVISEEGLKAKHTQEEQKVAENYAERLVKRDRLTQEDIDNLLQDHALSMQALRTRQDEEKNHMKKQMELKIRNRRNQKLEYSSKPNEPEESSQKETNSSVRMFYGSSSEAEDEDSDEDTEVLRDAIWSRMSVSRRLTAENIKDMVDSYAEEEEKSRQQHPRRSTSTKLSVVPEVVSQTNTPRAGEIVSVGLDANSNNTKNSNKNTESMHIPPISIGTDAHGGTSSSRSFSSTATGTDNSDNEETKTLLKEDEDFAKEFLNKNKNGMTPEDYSALMDKYLEDKNRLSKLKQQEKQRSKDKLKEKLGNATNRSGKVGSNEDEYSDNFETDDELVDPEETQELKNLKQKFLSSLDKKRKKDDLSEEDVQKMLAKYRKNQFKIIKNQQASKDQQTARLNDKLQERLKMKKENPPLDNGTAEDDDSEFFAKLQQMQANGELTKDQFSEMLKNYLDKKKEGTRRKKQIPSHDKEKDKEAALEIVQIYNKEKQEVLDMRRAQKEKTDALLKRRLQKNKNKRHQSPLDSDTNLSLNESYLDDSAYENSFVDESGDKH